MSRAFLLAAVSGCILISTVSADTWNKKTKVSFSAPFQIPGPNTKNGVVTLPPGSYVFRLLDSSSNRHIVQVTNTRENKVYSTILAVPDYRVNATSKTVMYFSERMSGAPMAVKSWFYPGDNFGQRFVYPKVKAQEIAAVVKQPVPSHAVETIEATNYAAVPVAIQTPAKQETAYNASEFEKHDATDSAGVDGEAVKAPAAATQTLPKTASPLPAAFLAGSLLLGLSLLTRRIASSLS